MIKPDKSKQRLLAQAFFVISPILFLFIISVIAGRAETAVKNIGVEDFFRILDSNPSIQVIDVRAPDKRSAAYLKSSKNILFGSLQSRIGEIDPKRPVIVYCETGEVSPAAARILQYRNFTKVYNLENGIMDFFLYLSSEKRTKNPGKKRIFDRIREIMVTSRPRAGLSFPPYPLEGRIGKRSSIGEYAGRPAMLAFFSASDEKQFSRIAGLKSRLAGLSPKTAFLPIAAIESDSELKKFEKLLDSKKWTGQIYYDRGKSLMRRIGIGSLPNFGLIDAEGVLRAVDITDESAPAALYGGLTLEQLAKTVAAGRLPPYPMTETALAEFRQKKLVGSAAPDFTLSDSNGKKVRLSSFKGKKNVLLIFGTLTCPYTKKELESTNECYSTSKTNMNLEVLAVIPGIQAGTEDAAKQYAVENKISFRMLLDSDMETFNRYFITSIPVWWVVDETGVIRYQEKGYNQYTCRTVGDALAQ